MVISLLLSIILKKSIKERAAVHRLQSIKKIFHVFAVVFLRTRVTFLFLVCERCICLENIKLCHRSCESGVTWATFAEATAHSLKFHLYRSWLFFSAFCNSSWGNTERGKKKKRYAKMRPSRKQRGKVLKYRFRWARKQEILWRWSHFYGTFCTSLS